jgi:thiamine-phosphate pyrophosphorylase
MSSPLPRLRPVLCYITDRRSPPPATPGDTLGAVLRKIGDMAHAGVDWIQIREKDLNGAAAAKLVRESLKRVAAERAREHGGTRIFINDRLDVAVAEGAGGVHLAENSVPVETARRLVESVRPGAGFAVDFLIGASTHSLERARECARSGADYVLFGPIFATPSKAAFGAPQGLERLAEVCDEVKIPVLAVGGITVENAGACLEAGAAGIAAIRLFQDAEDPANIVHRLRKQG